MGLDIELLPPVVARGVRLGDVAQPKLFRRLRHVKLGVVLVLTKVPRVSDLSRRYASVLNSAMVLHVEAMNSGLLLRLIVLLLLFSYFCGILRSGLLSIQVDAS